jgi:hypothetical protein
MIASFIALIYGYLEIFDCNGGETDMSIKLSAAALGVLVSLTAASSQARADNVISYTLTGAEFLDGATFSGAWVVDLTTGTLLSAEFTKGLGTLTWGTETGPSPAATFDTANTLFANLQVNVGSNEGVDEINILSVSGNDQMNFDFAVATGDIYSGNASIGSNDDWVTSGGNPSGANYVPLFASSGDPISSATPVTPIAEPASMALFGVALLSFGVLRRRRS